MVAVLASGVDSTVRDDRAGVVAVAAAAVAGAGLAAAGAEEPADAWATSCSSVA